jgi:excisionase family DNA binding protein
MERRPHHSLHELLLQDRYTPEEVAELLEIGLETVRHAAFAGELRAQIVGHDIISIRREDVLAWVKAQEGPESTPPRRRDV